MDKYPVSASDLVTPEDIKAKRVYFKYHYEQLAEHLNMAFYTGFMVGFCKDEKEFLEFQSNLDLRVQVIVTAKMMADMYFKFLEESDFTPPPPDASR